MSRFSYLHTFYTQSEISFTLPSNGCSFGHWCQFACGNPDIPGHIFSQQPRRLTSSSSLAPNVSALFQHLSRCIPFQDFRKWLYMCYILLHSFGDRCHFAHGDQDIRGQQQQRVSSTGFTSSLAPIGSGAKEFPLVWGDPISDAAGNVTHIATITFQADMAGSIIGKAGANVKQIQISSGAKVSVGYGFSVFCRIHVCRPGLQPPCKKGNLTRSVCILMFQRLVQVQACKLIAKNVCSRST
jgi:hypothetical protein